MNAVGVIAEYNPYHNGHRWQLQQAKQQSGCSASIVAMSGNFVQRGEPAIFDKWSRASMAVADGADLVIELPSVFAVRSAQYFATGGIRLLAELGIVSHISFGVENTELADLEPAAAAIDSNATKEAIRCGLKAGQTYATAIARAISNTSNSGYQTITSPNNILAIEYLRAIRNYAPQLVPIAVNRKGTEFHDTTIAGCFASATAIRLAIQSDKQISAITRAALPNSTQALANQLLTSGRGPVLLGDLEDIILAKLRTTNPKSIAKISDVSEGLEYKIHSCALQAGDINTLLQLVKSKRYPRTRLQRILIQLLLDITKQQTTIGDASGPLYARVLAFNNQGRSLLKEIKSCGKIPVITKTTHYLTDKQCYQTYQTPLQQMLAIDTLASDLYALGLSNPAWKQGGRDFRQSPVYVALPECELVL